MSSSLLTKFSGQLRSNEPLAAYTSWHVGGIAERLYKPLNLADLSLFLSTLPPKEPITWLGLGSNVLIPDKGIDGTVILTLGGLNELNLTSLEGFESDVLRAEAGITCAKLAKFCVKADRSGGAFFAGIPGTVGGALAMNAGAFGGETWNDVVAVEMIDRQGKIHLRLPAEFEVQYREVTYPFDEWFVAGYFNFTPGQGEQTQEAIKTLLQKRNQTQPIGTFNCGSVFRNPPSDHAARLIESCGLKGKKIGGACVSEKHANFVINQDDATAADVEQLIEYVRETVLQKTGINLVREYHALGQ